MCFVETRKQNSQQSMDHAKIIQLIWCVNLYVLNGLWQTQIAKGKNYHDNAVTNLRGLFGNEKLRNWKYKLGSHLLSHIPKSKELLTEKCLRLN